jgi:3alpha(or 20beta)-hydroxysteroid dehydrogenase
MARFDNKVVLVSGGARGQGAAEARLLVAQGAKVVIGDVLDNQGQALAVELGPAASFVRHDVTSEADWARAVEAAQKLGGLHGLVNNAGIYQPAGLMETDDALWQRHIQINQYGCFLGMKAVVPAMERSGGGSIVNISSVAGLKGSPGSFAYAATKWALRGMTKSAAIDLGGRKIRVNSVHPGPIDTSRDERAVEPMRSQNITLSGRRSAVLSDEPRFSIRVVDDRTGSSAGMPSGRKAAIASRRRWR